MTSKSDQADAEATSIAAPVFVNHLVLQALSLQVAILDIRARQRSSGQLESFFAKVELDYGRASAGSCDEPMQADDLRTRQLSGDRCGSERGSVPTWPVHG